MKNTAKVAEYPCLMRSKWAYNYWVRKFKRQEQQEADDNSFAEMVLPLNVKTVSKEIA